MGEIRTIFFWMSGVLTPSVPALLSKVLFECGQTEVNLPALPGFPRLCEDLALGQVDGLSFCESVRDLTQLDLDPAALANKMIDAMEPNPSVLETIDLLPERYDRRLVVDLPDPWFERVSERLGVPACFSPDGFIFLPRSGLPRLAPDVFYYLTHQAQIAMPDGLLIDASAKRAVEVLNHGLHAAIFVSAWRLEREFIMRYFISKPQPVHKPSV